MNVTSKKIAFIVDTMGSGGAERVVSMLANNFSNFDISIFCIGADKNESFYKLNDNVKLFSCPEHSKIKRLKYLISFVRNNKFDLLISFLPHVCIYSFIASKITKTPLICSERSDPNTYNLFYKKILKFIYQKSDGVVFQTNDAKRFFFVKEYNQIRVILNPISIEQIKWKKANSKILVSTGRFVDAKNQAFLIKTFKKLVSIDKEYALHIYGEGPLKSDIKLLINELGLENNVFIYSPDENWLKNEINADLFILTSKYEGLPNALMEALSIGMPAVSSDCPIGGPKDIAKFTSNLFLYKNFDEDDCFLQIKNALTMSNYERPTLLNSKIDIKSICDEWIKLIDSIVGDNKNGK